MPTQTSICNQALVKLGAGTIISIDQETTEAILCKTFYDDTLFAILEEHPWTFALKRYELPRSAESPPKPYVAQYLIPSEVIRILNASANPDFDKHNTTDWQVEGGFIISNTEQMYIRAVIEEKDPSKFTAGFVRAFVSRLAAEMCTAANRSRELQAQLFQEYSANLGSAISADGQQGRSRKYRSDQLVVVRTAGTSFAGPVV